MVMRNWLLLSYHNYLYILRVSDERIWNIPEVVLDTVTLELWKRYNNFVNESSIAFGHPEVVAKATKKIYSRWYFKIKIWKRIKKKIK